MSDVIILRSVYGKVGQKYFIQPCADPKTKRFPDCVKSVNSNGDMVLSESDKEKLSRGEAHFIKITHVFIIEDGFTLDLSDIVDQTTWEAIKNTDIIAAERSAKDSQGNLLIDGGVQRYGSAELYVERPGEVTKARVTKKQLVFFAQKYIYEDSETERIKKCKVLGRNLSGATVSDVLDYMLIVSEKTPQRIINLYEDEDWKMQLFIIDAVERNVIQKRSGVYQYEDKLLGGSIDAVITMLSDIKHRNFLNSIKRQTYPEYATKEEISIMEADIMKGMPHSGQDETVEEPAVNNKKKK